ncbi:hypothetical protein [Cellulomonas telluris]|uniref:hypothetical protein n=1 Tax=Cellulomonas telluris TaxID=2306636 RepID=UPI0010A929FF|nr:hypothetical protein [Cellulomonas telluris]
MSGTPSPVPPITPAAAPCVPGPGAAHGPETVVRARHRSPRPAVGARLRAAALVAGLTAALAAAVVTSPAAATSLPAPVTPGTVVPAAPADGLAPPAEGTQPLATIEDEEAWCSYLTSYYLAFPSPWSARVYNCQHRAMSVAPVYSNGTVGSCVRVPARHSRHLGGNVAKWVTDIRVC